MTTVDADAILARATPAVHQQGHEIQPFNHVVVAEHVVNLPRTYTE